MKDAIHILLVDDEPRNLDALEATPRRFDPGYRLLRADDADKALRLLLSNDVAAIVLDIKMPVMNGIELAQLIKGTKKFRQTPILFLTAHLLDEHDVLTGYGAGAVDYLTKPVNPQIFRQKVAVFAELFRKTRDLAELNAHLETRVQERTAELEKSEGALRAASKQKDLFLATLSHELRNPLAPLRVGLDILLREPEQPVVARTLGAMNRQLDHLVGLVDDLLDVSRIAGGALEMRREYVALSSVIERAMETAGPWLTKRQQSVTVDAAEPVPAFVDATRIAQIIGNLLHNASKHSPSGARVRIELRRDGPMAYPGHRQWRGHPLRSARARLRHVREDRARGAARERRTRIGLALSRKHAELQGGTLTVASAGEGEGATFTLSVPTGGAHSVVEAPGAGSPRSPAPPAP